MIKENKRRHIRYPAEPNELVTVYFMDEQAGITGQRVGLGQDDSFKGCCVVFVGDMPFRNGQEVMCECGKLPKVAAKVAWIKELDKQVAKVGFQFLE